MDLLPASSLLSPLSRVLIHTETQFHLTEPIFLLVLIYGPDHDLRELKGDGGGRGGEARGGGGGSGGLREGERVEVGAARGPYPADWAEWSGSHHPGKSPVGALFSAGAAKHRGLCSGNNNSSQKRTEGRPSRVYIVP